MDGSVCAQKRWTMTGAPGYFKIAELLPLQKVQALFHLEDVRDEVDTDELFLTKILI